MIILINIADGISDLSAMYVDNDFFILQAVSRKIFHSIAFFETISKYCIQLQYEACLFRDILQLFTFFHQFLIDFIAYIF